MILIVHILAGATIFSKFYKKNKKTLLLAGLLVLLSHFVLDMLPQWQYNIFNIGHGIWNKSYIDFLKIFIDAFIGFSLVFFLAKKRLAAFCGGIISTFPDFLQFLNILFPKFLAGFSHFHSNIQFLENSVSPLIGLIIEIIISILAIVFLLKTSWKTCFPRG